MKILLLLVLFAAPLVSASEPPRQPFPDDYTATPCAPDVCAGYTQWDLPQHAWNLRRFDVSYEWLQANWESLTAALKPLCAKIATCMTLPGNDWTECSDIVRDEFIDSSNRFERDSFDWEQWRMAALTYFIGMARALQTNQAAAQACGRKQFGTDERTMDVRIEPPSIPPDFDGILTIYAFDSETRVPVIARLTVDGRQPLRSDFSPRGYVTTFYPARWRTAMNRLPNRDGHQNVVPPTLKVEAKGYRTLEMPMPVPVGTMKVKIRPRRLRAGTNRFTVTARDAATGEPVEARVMAGDRILGNTNEPLSLDLKRGEKRPEIWVTSLFDRYSDVVVLRGAR